MKRSLLLLTVLLAATGCASSVKGSRMRVTTAPPATPRAIAIEVDSLVPDAEGDQATLRAGLRKAFAALGYEVDSGDLLLRATITKLHRGNTFANVSFGLGIGSDTIDVSVALADAKGEPCLTFEVHGKAIDKRYSDLNAVIRDLARKIAAEVKRASR